jgi:hypothetical protein
MFTKNSLTYSTPGYYLKGDNIIAFQMEGDASTFEEVELKKPYDITIVGGNLLLFDGIAILAEDLTKKGIKSHIIKMRYDNDDQIALMLNRNNSEEDAKAYQLMQDWRQFADDVAVAAMSNLK